MPTKDIAQPVKNDRGAEKHCTQVKAYKIVTITKQHKSIVYQAFGILISVPSPQVHPTDSRCE